MGAVVAHGGPGVGGPSDDLDVAQVDPAMSIVVQRCAAALAGALVSEASRTTIPTRCVVFSLAGQQPRRDNTGMSRRLPVAAG